MLIPYGKQEITAEDISAVVDVLKSDYLTQGPTVPAFEKKFREYVNADYAIAVNSATSALHIACMALDLGPGDILWTSPMTFVASSNCGLYCGAKVDFVDIDESSRNISVEKLEEKLIDSAKLGKLPKVLVVVHLAGMPCELEKIKNLSSQYGFKIIEDASHAVGAKYHGSPIGSGNFSHCTVFSFHPVKIITSGEGGMVTTNSKTLFDSMARLRTHGITANPEQMLERPNNEIWNFQQVELGLNYRMTDIQAALGQSQLTRVDKIVSKRNQISDFYDDAFKDLPIKLPPRQDAIYSSFHLYQIELMERAEDQKEIYNFLRNKGILVNIHYIPVYLHPYYAGLGFKRNYCPVSEVFFRRSLSLPMYPTLTQEELEFVCASMKEVFS
jgi:UDP-4-amino-4,6-dideoxy-N-acetyl-beta-L-altrosamine transaminase